LPDDGDSFVPPCPIILATMKLGSLAVERRPRHLRLFPRPRYSIRSSGALARGRGILMTMTGEAEALLSLAASMPGDPDALRAASGKVEDWDSLAGLTERNGLAGILWSELRRAGVSPPLSAIRRLEEFVTLQRLRQPRLERSLEEAIGAVANAGVPCALLKGPFLGERLYGEAALRPSVDLDLLVAADDLDRATAGLGDAGWRVQEGASARWHRRHHHHLLLGRPGSTDVELHFRAHVGFGAVLPAEDLLGRTSPSEFLGKPVRLLAPEDEALYLAVHAAGHGLARLLWLVDLKGLLALHPGLDWGAIVARARACGLRRAAAFSFAAASDLGAEIPPEALVLSPLRRRAATRAGHAALGLARPGSTVGSLALNAILADGPLPAARFVSAQLARIARRRAARALGRHAPHEWSA
jgi:hypothetical protein